MLTHEEILAEGWSELPGQEGYFIMFPGIDGLIFEWYLYGEPGGFEWDIQSRVSGEILSSLFTKYLGDIPDLYAFRCLQLWLGIKDTYTNQQL